MVDGNIIIGFPLLIADSKQDIPGFKPEPDRLVHQQHSTNRAIRIKAIRSMVLPITAVT